MFYISRNIETEVFFTHHDMDKVASDEEILRRLRDKVEGYCHAEYGYVIQVIASSSDAKFFIDRVDIRKNGLFVRLKFSCIVFRPAKNEIMAVVVSEISQGSIMGKMGPVHVMIPQTKLVGEHAHFRVKESAFEFSSPRNQQTRLIKAGSIVYCRCFETRVEMNCSMRIIGAIDLDLLQLNIDKDNSD